MKAKESCLYLESTDRRHVGGSFVVKFLWNELSFVLSLDDCNKLVDMMFEASANLRHQEDDFVQDLWVNERILRYKDQRFPIESIDDLHEKICDVTEYRRGDSPWQRLQKTPSSEKDVTTALQELHKGLGLD